MKKQELSPETIEKLEWLKSQLRKYPHKYNQEVWCGSQGCLAGYILSHVYAHKLNLNHEGVMAVSEWELDDAINNAGFCTMRLAAAAWLGLVEPMYQDGVFDLFSGRWEGDASEFNRSQTDTDEQAAEKARQRIDLLIASGGTI